MATIGDFDPLNSSVPATKIEVTVSCREKEQKETQRAAQPLIWTLAVFLSTAVPSRLQTWPFILILNNELT
ncbi:copine-9 isoform X1 [Tachysurus ichikawai]